MKSAALDKRLKAERAYWRTGCTKRGADPMILYTPMPYEAIYAEEQGERKLQQVNIQGVPVMVEMKEDEAEIVQVMSTNPMDF